MSHDTEKSKIDRREVLEERNNKDEAFMKDQQKQAERDQLVMPVDDISNDLLEKEQKYEKEKRATFSSEDTD